MTFYSCAGSVGSKTNSYCGSYSLVGKTNMQIITKCKIITDMTDAVKKSYLMYKIPLERRMLVRKGFWDGRSLTELWRKKRHYLSRVVVEESVSCRVQHALWLPVGEILALKKELKENHGARKQQVVRWGRRASGYPDYSGLWKSY